MPSRSHRGRSLPNSGTRPPGRNRRGRRGSASRCPPAPSAAAGALRPGGVSRLSAARGGRRASASRTAPSIREVVGRAGGIRWIQRPGGSRDVGPRDTHENDARIRVLRPVQPGGPLGRIRGQVESIGEARQAALRGGDPGRRIRQAGQASRATRPTCRPPLRKRRPHGAWGVPRRRRKTARTAPASASARMIGRTTPIPGPESSESPEVGEAEAKSPCELLGAVAAAASAASFPPARASRGFACASPGTAPCQSRLRFRMRCPLPRTPRLPSPSDPWVCCRPPPGCSPCTGRWSCRRAPPGRPRRPAEPGQAGSG